MRLFCALIAVALASAAAAQDATVTLAWDAVDDTRVGVYEVHFGTATGDYNVGSVSVDAPSTTAPVVQPVETTYFYAVRACTTDLSLCSAFSNEISHTVEAVLPPPTGTRVQSTTFVQ